MRIKDYVQALYALLKDGSELEPTLSHMRAYLKKRGLSSLYPRILRGLIEKLRRSDRVESGRIIVAREKDARHALHEAKMHEGIFGEMHKDAVEVDPNIIGGFILEKGGSRLDQSHKRALLDAYRRLTH
jgi:F0F1-type ATP synthase delta subunit